MHYQRLYTQGQPELVKRYGGEAIRSPEARRCLDVLNNLANRKL